MVRESFIHNIITSTAFRSFIAAIFLSGFLISSPASAADGDNIIGNPSLETASPGNPAMPQGWLKGGFGANTRNLTYPVTGSDGGSAVRVDITSYTSGDAKWYFTDVPVNSGDIYLFKDQFRSDVSSYITLRFKKSDGTFTYSEIASLPSGSGWQTVQKNFTIPSGVVSLTIFHAITDVGFLVTDNYELRKVVTPPSDPNNKIPNPSVEIPSPDPNRPSNWQKGGYGNNTRVLTYPVPGYDGASAAKVQVSNYVAGDAKWYFNNVSVIPGDNYEFSDFYLSNTTSFVTVQFKKSDGTFTYQYLDDLPPASSWTQFKRTFNIPAGTISLTIFHAIRSNGSLTVDAYYLKKFTTNKFDEGMVSLTFDDGFASVYQNAFPMLENANIRSTQYFVHRYLNNFSGYMNTNQALEMNYAGHDADGHTRSHAHLTQLSDAQAWDEIHQSRLDLLAMGFDPVSTFAYPFGEYDNRIVQMVKDAGYIGARTVDDGYNYRDTDKFRLMVQHGDHYSTPAQMKAWVDQARADRSWLIIKLHNIRDDGSFYSTPIATLQSLVDYIDQTGIKTVTTTEGIGLMNP